MSTNSSSCTPPGNGHVNGYPVPHYPFFFPPVLGGLSPPSINGLQHQLPVSGYSTPSPATKLKTKLISLRGSETQNLQMLESCANNEKLERLSESGSISGQDSLLSLDKES